MAASEANPMKNEKKSRHFPLTSLAHAHIVPPISPRDPRDTSLCRLLPLPPHPQK
jgi:hypothetical protein